MRRFLIPYLAGMWGMAAAMWENPGLHPLGAAAICTAVIIPAAVLISRMSALSRVPMPSRAATPTLPFDHHKPHPPEVDAALMDRRAP